MISWCLPGPLPKRTIMVKCDWSKICRIHNIYGAVGDRNAWRWCQVSLGITRNSVVLPFFEKTNAMFRFPPEEALGHWPMGIQWQELGVEHLLPPQDYGSLGGTPAITRFSSVPHPIARDGCSDQAEPACERRWDKSPIQYVNKLLTRPELIHSDVIHGEFGSSPGHCAIPPTTKPLLMKSRGRCLGIVYIYEKGWWNRISLLS